MACVTTPFRRGFGGILKKLLPSLLSEMLAILAFAKFRKDYLWGFWSMDLCLLPS
jgi:hypothetical protein